METFDKSVFEHIQKHIFVGTYNNNIPRLTSKTSYQLCMRTLMETLTTKICNQSKVTLNENIEQDCIYVFLTNVCQQWVELDKDDF